MVMNDQEFEQLSIAASICPSRPSEVAVLAVKTYTVFMAPPQTDAEIVAAIVATCWDFDRGAAAMLATGDSR